MREEQRERKTNVFCYINGLCVGPTIFTILQLCHSELLFKCCIHFSNGSLNTCFKPPILSTVI